MIIAISLILLIGVSFFFTSDPKNLNARIINYETVYISNLKSINSDNFYENFQIELNYDDVEILEERGFIVTKYDSKLKEDKARQIKKKYFGEDLKIEKKSSNLFVIK